MHASSHTVWKKISASLILVLFIFIHVEKAFHKHQHEANYSQQKTVALNSVNTNCPICDFQLSKDSELPSLVALTINSVCVAKEYIVSTSFYHYLPAEEIANRGPPAI